jgi:AcrR family transcriptional regulator
VSPATYNSPKRDEAKDNTRAAILEALVRVVIDDGIHAFSVANVAKRAGVSHRTVYRHFPSRDALIEGFSASVDALDTESPQGVPASLLKIAVDVERMFLRALVSSHTWFHVRGQLGVDPAIAGRGLGRAARLVLNDLKRRQNAAKAGGSNV